MNNLVPCVSVIIPVYNKEEYIGAFLESLKKQTLYNLEFLFIDDKGKDRSIDEVKKYSAQDSRFVCIENEKNSGPGYSRNRGIEAARGEYIAFADADDIVAPNFYELLYKKAKETGAFIVKGQHVICEGTKEKKSSLLTIIKNNFAARGSLLNLFTYEHQSAIFSRAWVMQEGARNSEDTRNGEDTCFLMIATRNLDISKFAYEEAALYRYRHVSGSLSHSNKNGFYLEQYTRCCVFKIDYMLPRMRTKEEIDYVSSIFERVLGNALNECELGGASIEERIASVEVVAARLKQWKSMGNYRPRVFANLLDCVNFNARVFCEVRNLQIIKREVRAVQEQVKKLNDTTEQLRKLIELSNSYKNIQRQYRLTKVLSALSIGNARKRYKAKKQALKKQLHYIKSIM